MRNEESSVSIINQWFSVKSYNAIKGPQWYDVQVSPDEKSGLT